MVIISHIIGLDILRLLASVLVMSYHFVFWNWVKGQPFNHIIPDQAPEWGIVLHFGWVGVEVFFVISGFVIAYTMSYVRPASFLRNRFLRLAPVSWIAATLILVIQLAIGASPALELARRYADTLVFWPFEAIDSAWWTLGIEVDFYLLAYVMLRRGRAGSLEKVVMAIGLASGLFWAIALALQVGLDGTDGLPGMLHYLVIKAEGNRALQLLLVQHGCLFALGVVMWAASTSGFTRVRVAAMAVLAAACILEIAGQNGIISRAANADLALAPAIAAWSAAMALLVFSIACNGWLTRRIGRGAPVVRFIGLVTYPLYLVHNAIGIGSVEAFGPSIGFSAVGFGAVAAFVCAIFIADRADPWLRGLLSSQLPLPVRVNTGPAGMRKGRHPPATR